MLENKGPNEYEDSVDDINKALPQIHSMKEIGPSIAVRN